MCGRYGCVCADEERIKKTFRLKKIDFTLVPRYNIAPGQDVPVILNEAAQELQLARWGLVPSWAKDEKVGYKMINARAETIFEKPAFRGVIRHKRCLIPADFFYEWQPLPGGKQPFCIRLKSKEPFAFAGIWDCFEKSGNALLTCSIITCPANKTLSAIHERMPVILPPENFDQWLTAQESKDISSLLKPITDKLLETYPVSTLVNSATHEGAELIKPAG